MALKLGARSRDRHIRSRRFRADGHDNPVGADTKGFECTRRVVHRRRLLCFAGAAVVVAACAKRSFESLDVSGADWGKDFRLRDAEGRERSLADYRGKAVLVFFGFTQCPDVCPTALSRAAEVLRLLGDDGRKLQVIFVTIDPERDSPAVLKAYTQAFHPSFLGLWGDLQATEATSREFKVFYQLRFSPDMRWFVTLANRLDHVDIYRWQPGDADRPLQLAKRIPTGRTPSHQWIDSTSRTVYASMQESSELVAIDLQMQSLRWRVPTGKLPADVYLTADDRTLFVALTGDRLVEVYDVSSGPARLLQRIETGEGAHAFRALGDKRHVFVGNRAADTISLIDTQNRTVVAQLPGPGGPDCMELSSDRRTLLVSSRYRFEVDSNVPDNSGTVDAGITSPKLSLVFGPWDKTEYFVNAGYGLHSNDARGVTIKVDPVNGDPVDAATPLVRSKGAELGARSELIPNVQSSLALWALKLDSELVFIGDAGNTEAGRPSERYGVEWSNRWRPLPWMSIDLDLSWNHARFTGDAPEGNYIPGAPRMVAQAGIAVDRYGP